MEHQYSDRIVRLLQLYLLGDITEEERQELEDWCEEAPRNRKLFEQLVHMYNKFFVQHLCVNYMEVKIPQ